MRVPGSVLTHPGQDPGQAVQRFVQKAEADRAGRLHDIMEPLNTIEAGSGRRAIHTQPMTLGSG
jgi:hypothetical protein